VPKFFYQAKNAAGQMVRGSIESPNETEAKIRLRAQNLNPIKVAQAVTSQRPAPGGAGFFFAKSFSERVANFYTTVFNIDQCRDSCCGFFKNSQ
jgi:type II secretory pathway component PulF